MESSNNFDLKANPTHPTHPNIQTPSSLPPLSKYSTFDGQHFSMTPLNISPGLPPGLSSHPSQPPNSASNSVNSVSNGQLNINQPNINHNHHNGHNGHNGHNNNPVLTHQNHQTHSNHQTHQPINPQMNNPQNYDPNNPRPINNINNNPNSINNSLNGLWGPPSTINNNQNRQNSLNGIAGSLHNGPADGKEVSEKLFHSLQLAENKMQDLQGLIQALQKELHSRNLKINELKSEKNFFQEALVCQICFERPRDTVLLPCLHLMFCGVCTEKEVTCRVCGVLVSGKLGCLTKR